MKKIILLFVVIVTLSDTASSQFRNRNKNKDADQIDYSQQREYEISGISVIGITVLDENALISLKIGRAHV